MWNQLSTHHRERGSVFDDFMRRLDADHPTFLPPLQRSRGLMVFSDFAGDLRNSRFSTFSFVIAPMESIPSWNYSRTALRQHFRLGRRRLAYSKLNDTRRRKAMPFFAQAANAISGLSVTVLIDKRIKSIFTPGGYDPSRTAVSGRTFTTRKSPVLERTLRAAFLVAVFLAGLSAPEQNLLWVTDEDDIAADPDALAHLGDAFRSILAYNAAHSVGEVQVATTVTAGGEALLAEDYTSIADIVGGAVTSLICSYGSAVPLHSFVVPAPEHLPDKTKALILQLFKEDAVLRKLIFTAQPFGDGSARIVYGFPKITFQRGLIAQSRLTLV